MVDEADRRLGSSVWGGPPSMGHPECFPPKGRLYLPLVWPLYELLCTFVCVYAWLPFHSSFHCCVCSLELPWKSWYRYLPLSRDISKTLFVLTSSGSRPQLAVMSWTFTPRCVTTLQRHSCIYWCSREHFWPPTDSCHESPRDKDTDFQPSLQQLIVLKQISISLLSHRA